MCLYDSDLLEIQEEKNKTDSGFKFKTSCLFGEIQIVGRNSSTYVKLKTCL